jgi:GNAT superfamily N-acetyltransferase
MHVRVATEADVPALASLRRASAEDEGDPDFERRFAAWFAAERARTTWLASVDGEPVGFVGLLEYRRMPKPGSRDGLWGYLGNMFVLEAHRGRGIGAALVSAVLAHADARGYVRVVLSPSERAIPLYKRAGFVEADGTAGDRLLVRVPPNTPNTSSNASAPLLNRPRAE